MVTRHNQDQRKRANYVITIGLVCLLAGCTLAPTKPISTAPPPEVETSLPPPQAPTGLVNLLTDTRPYTNVTSLLNGVCFEYLVVHADEEWQWTTAADLNAFFAEVNDSALCPDPVSAAEFDFTERGLIGAIQRAEGCDAAHRVLNTPQAETAGTITLQIELVIQTGCPYELIQPLLIAVPHAWATETIHLEWIITTIPPNPE